MVGRIVEQVRFKSIDIGRKLQLFPYPLHLTPPLGVFPLVFREKVWSLENKNHGATRQ